MIHVLLLLLFDDVACPSRGSYLGGRQEISISPGASSSTGMGKREVFRRQNQAQMPYRFIGRGGVKEEMQNRDNNYSKHMQQPQCSFLVFCSRDVKNVLRCLFFHNLLRIRAVSLSFFRPDRQATGGGTVN
jgi:hypothetical protein